MNGVIPAEEKGEEMTKQVHRVEATFRVKAVFDVIAESKGEASNLAAAESTDVHIRAITLGVEAGEFDVGQEVIVEDLGEASEADIKRLHAVMAIRP